MEQSINFLSKPSNTRILDLFFRWLCACSFQCSSVASVLSDCGTPWTVAHQASLSMELSRQEYWSGLSYPSPWHHPDPEIEHTSLTSSELASGFLATSATWEAPNWFYKTNTFSVVMYGCESCTKNKVERQRIDGF